MPAPSHPAGLLATLLQACLPSGEEGDRPAALGKSPGPADSTAGSGGSTLTPTGAPAGKDTAAAPADFPHTVLAKDEGDQVVVHFRTLDGRFTYRLLRSAHGDGRDSVAVASVEVASLAGHDQFTLRDRPAAGNWYYRLEAERSDSTVLRRSGLLPVEGYTGQAYILERAGDPEEPWNAVDTVPALSGGMERYIRNVPPSRGHWSYRLRSIRAGAASRPGPSSRTVKPWSDSVAYRDDLQVEVVDLGGDVRIDGNGYAGDPVVRRSVPAKVVKAPAPAAVP